MRRAADVSSRAVPLALAALLLVSAACGKHHLNQYEYSGSTLALVFIEPPEPELLHGWYNLDGFGPLNAAQTVVGAGARVAREVEARRALARFDSAAASVDVTALLARRTLERVSRYLGTRIVATPETADFVLELNMRAFGVDARSNRSTSLFTRAEAVLLDRATGREIWSEDVRASDRMTPYVVGTNDVPSAIFTAATLHTVTVEDFRRALEGLTGFTADVITNELRDRLRDVRDR